MARSDFRQTLVGDLDPSETADWVDSIDAVVSAAGKERAHFLLDKVQQHLQEEGVRLPYLVRSPYVNTIPPEVQPAYPGDHAIEWRIRSIIRWNAAVMVHRANKRFDGLGGHLSTYASAATLYEVGFQHFFRGPDAPGGADHVFFQGHSSPGIYARAYLEGRIDEARLNAFRRETPGTGGLSSYPHPHLMPDFWQFSTVSMGLGPLAAIYQARFDRYLHARGIADTSQRRVWAFLGDGETDEPESLGSLSIAAREGLDNLVFVINCNLQRLDGPVRGNGKIIQELESIFAGAGWNVVKLIWGGPWDALLARDHDGMLKKRMDEVPDGEYQKYVTSDVAYVREQFFGKYPSTRAMADTLSDADLRTLSRGGHDPGKVYAAYHAAVHHANGKPTVILAKTIKGHALGGGFEGRNTTHQQKKFDVEALAKFRTRLQLPISDAALEDPPFYHPGADSAEVRYLQERRAALGGYLPQRRVRPVQVALPGERVWKRFAAGSGTTEVSTTGAFVGMMGTLLREGDLGRRVVPILCDEGRTFGIEAFFKPYGIYSALGQRYTPVDADFLLAYREATDGQILQEGITEAGSTASFLAAGTAYATHGQPMVPMYFFYSMFGFQRVGDLIWAAADMNARGFLLGCTAGRTTLNGEGLQHEDGHSLILASTNPGVRSYETAWAWELALLLRDGLERMLQRGENVIYYLTLQNESWAMPPEPAGASEGVLRGCYLQRPAAAVEGAALAADAPRLQLLGSGSILHQVLQAQQVLVREHGVAADVWSVTSYQALRDEQIAADRAAVAGGEPAPTWLETTLGATSGPIVAASDWMRLVPDQIAPWLDGRLYSLGTDGFGMSDTREALRAHFGVDAAAIVAAARWRLGRRVR